MLKGMLDSLKTDAVGVNFDPANLVMITGEDILKGVCLLEGKIFHTHAKDGKQLKEIDPSVLYHHFADGKTDLNAADYFTEAPLGEGSVGFPSYLKALEQAGYHGFLTIEGSDGPQAIEQSISFLKEMIK